MNNIVIYGASGRHNLGDLLFPIITKKLLDKYLPKNTYKVYIASLVDSNFEIFGATPSVSIVSTLKFLGNTPVTLIHVGGEILSCPIEYGLGMSLPQPLAENLLNSRDLDDLKRKQIAYELTGIPFDYPYVIPKDYLPEGSKVVFNGVGGTALKNIGIYKRLIINRINKSEFLGVRENTTIKLLSVERLECTLMPDCVSAIKQIYPYPDRLVSNEFKNMCRKQLGKKYIVFQMNGLINMKSYPIIVSQLQKTCKAMKCRLIILPLAYASLHGDVPAGLELSRLIASKIRHKVYLNLTIWEMIWLIANSKLFIGTSLHGRIISMSYGVPRISLAFHDKKVESYSKTWDIISQPSKITVRNIYKAAQIAVVEKPEKLNELSDKLKNLYLKSFLQMCKVVGLLSIPLFVQLQSNVP